MKSLLLLVLLYIPFSSATCAFLGGQRCKKAGGSVNGDYERTLDICNDVHSDMCYCVKKSEDYCTAYNSTEANEFDQECTSQVGWTTFNC
ncbi:hypothetical protein N7517_003797 [Penicillium concentricum]|uniref:Extracellular membrane protein CFEM domain-containing protein n=1 Tax=Penicillium concentricum TaxID=293559 RepID=A0A9W9S4C9_9EURO|nr:uncharacterized protein N7517_003797 [Penicillium concentricum]KAJ5371791.1 hypothetical protein N7517_003797 [Penicillium concentricum]